VENYNENYRRSNYFGYRTWLYRPFVEAVVRKTGLKRGARLLDAGCGQGFFTQLFAKNGLDALGVDISAAGVASAREMYRSSGAKFELGNVLELGWKDEFDCVFTRSCSLYNSGEFEAKRGVTDQLLSYLRPGGILIFDYYSRLGATGESREWIYHSMASVQNHFSHYPGAEVYFSLRVETMLLGKFSFSRQVSGLCATLSNRLGVGGELVVFLRKPPVAHPLS
jgi:SAM-dependent methyltransferase